MRLAMTVENASLTRLRHHGNELRVDAAPEVAHLPPDERSLM
jgi:hypothetical protein